MWLASVTVSVDGSRLQVYIIYADLRYIGVDCRHRYGLCRLQVQVLTAGIGVEGSVNCNGRLQVQVQTVGAFELHWMAESH